MASGPALSTASGRLEINHSLSLLDVLDAKQFEGESFPPELLDQTEEDFYRGAPPKWLNFHISEQRESNGTGTPFIKRDGYDMLVEKIHQKKKLSGISTVKLFHQPGCGGSTLAMKVLWDLRKTFRTAVLTGPTSDMTKVAEEVVQLFTAGSRHNTVLLLVNDEKNLESLPNKIKMKIAEQNIHVHTHMPVAILLNCVRKDAALASDYVVLQKVISEEEKQKFDEKKKELSTRYRDRYKQFHGFNIIQTNFSQAYIQEACSVFETTKTEQPPKNQLAAFLSLLNAYVPGSYLLESQCLDFFKHDDYMHGDFSLEDRMEPFSHLIITFQQDERSEKKVCMAHPMIAQCCTELMARSGVTRSDTARNLLTCFCREEFPPFLVGFVKDMLTKRETKPKENLDAVNDTETREDKERYSRLIRDLQKFEGNKQSALVLKVASNKFDQNPFFPQALARVYYTELQYYTQAETWAKKAKLREPKNSFVADTLGQVHKNHLNLFKIKKHTAEPREILQLASKAIEAFKDEERLAENECGTEMRGDGNTKVSNLFNIRGQFGYVEVCNLVYDQLVRQNSTWREVLTNKLSLESVLESLGDNKLFRFNDLINSLRDEIERKCAFFDKYLTYSKPDFKDDPAYISKGTSECYRNFVGNSPSKDFIQKGADLIQKLKQNLADTSAGVLSCLDRECTESDLKEITTWWEEIFLQKDTVTALVNYILAHIMLRNMGAILPSDCKYLAAFKQKMPLIPIDSPELHMLALLLCWPTDSEAKCVLDLNELIRRMHRSYEVAYEIHFRSRYLRPLFFIGNGEDLNRIVHRKVLENLFTEGNEETKQDWSNNWNKEKIFRDPNVQARLVKVEGVVKNYRVYATLGDMKIEVEANHQNSLWRPRQVSFYLGFNIRGPVAFAIQTKPAAKDKKAEEISGMDSSEPEDTTGGHYFVDRHQTDLINRVSDTRTILDKLKDGKWISQENYETLSSLNNTQDQMSGIIQCLTSVGKDVLYKILKRMKSMRPLIAELEGSE